MFCCCCACVCFFSFFSVANIISLCHGMAIGWLSPNLPKLQSDDSPLQTGPMTLSETSWIGSCFSIGAIVGNCIFGVLSNYIGRKNTLCILALPNLVNRYYSCLHLFRLLQLKICLRSFTKCVFVIIVVLCVLPWLLHYIVNGILNFIVNMWYRCCCCCGFCAQCTKYDLTYFPHSVDALEYYTVGSVALAAGQTREKR